MLGLPHPARCTAVAAVLLWTGIATTAQEMPSECQAVLTALGKTGDFKDGVLKVNIPRNDLRVTIAQRPAPTPFGFGGWIALTKGTGGNEVLMGDLVLTEDEVNPVMSAVLNNGLDVTALHSPRLSAMRANRVARSTRSRLAGPTSASASTAPASPTGWASIPGPHL